MPALQPRPVLPAVVLALTLGCDQATKEAARQYLSTGGPKQFVSGLLTLQFIQNPGCFLSFGAEWSQLARRLIFTGLNGLLLVAGLWFLLRSRDLGRRQTLALSLVVAGGLGNLLDRLSNAGAVTDFLMLSAGPLRTGVFNLADMAVVTGCVLMLLELRSRKPAAA